MIVKIHGGLGNQLFQYAFGRAMELRHNISVKYDFTYFSISKSDKVTLWPYELPKFNLHLNTAKTIDRIPFIVGNKLGSNSLKVYVEKKLVALSPEKLVSKSQGFFIGYWQNVNYFADFASVIRKELNDGVKVNQANENYISEIALCESVSIHIRRGDYLNSGVNMFMKDPLEYYRNAIKHVTSSVSNPEFYVFSDDLQWAKENLVINDHPVSFVGINKGDDSYQDMILMSRCKHNIIANSSFSWWGAFLNENSTKTVVGPKNWVFEDTNNLKGLQWKAL